MESSSLKKYDFVQYFYQLEKENHWDYIGKKDKLIDKIAPYPAKMVSDMQGEIISSIKNEIEIKSIFDPFMGSGTILTESVLLGISEIYGNDINPLSKLIVKVKTKKINMKKLNRIYDEILNEIYDEKLIIKNRYFFNITKWYSIKTIHQLSKIINAIEKIKDKDIREFFELGFSNLVKEVSNTRITTFKLHIKEVIVEYNDCFERYKKIIDLQIISCNKFWSKENYEKVKIKLYNNDLKKLSINKKFDMIITSPPYGDNKTTVTYGEFSILQLKWLGREKYTSKYSEIDNASLGGTLCKLEEIKKIKIYKKSKTVREIVNKLLVEANDDKKARKVVTFMQDFFETIKKLSKLLNEEKGKLILTVGNRKVNGNEIFFNKIIDEMAEEIGIKKLQEFSRNLPLTKKIAKNTSKLSNGKSVKSMDKEYVLIYSKK